MCQGDRHGKPCSESTEEAQGTFRPSTSRDRKVGGRAWTVGLLKSSQGQVAGNPIQGAHKSERFNRQVNDK